MDTKIKRLWSGLDRNIVVNQRELVLGIAVCALAGTLLGVLISPRKTMTIGSNNGSNNMLPASDEPSVCPEAETPETKEV